MSLRRESVTANLIGDDGERKDYGVKEEELERILSPKTKSGRNDKSCKGPKNNISPLLNVNCLHSTNRFRIKIKSFLIACHVSRKETGFANVDAGGDFLLYFINIDMILFL